MSQRQILSWQILFPHKVYKLYLTLIFYLFIFIQRRGSLMEEEVKAQRSVSEMGGEGRGQEITFKKKRMT